MWPAGRVARLGRQRGPVRATAQVLQDSGAVRQRRLVRRGCRPARARRVLPPLISSRLLIPARRGSAA